MTKESVVRTRLRTTIAACALCFGMLSVGAVATPVAAATTAPAKQAVKPAAKKPTKKPVKKAAKKPAKAKTYTPAASPTVTRFAERVIANHDNAGRTFVIVDKLQGSVFVFHPDGSLNAATAALVGLAAGDDSVPGIGDRELNSIAPDERTTPAGRYLASFRPNGGKKKTTLWVDYDTAIALHPLRELTRAASKTQRLKRLKTQTPEDNRITFGCINVPDAFFDEVVTPAFKGTVGIVYVLPDTRTMSEVFPTLGRDLDMGGSIAAGAK